MSTEQLSFINVYDFLITSKHKKLENEELFDYIRTHYDIIKIIMKNHGNMSFSKKFEDYVKKISMEKLKIKSQILDKYFYKDIQLILESYAFDKCNKCELYDDCICYRKNSKN